MDTQQLLEIGSARIALVKGIFGWVHMDPITLRAVRYHYEFMRLFLFMLMLAIAGCSGDARPRSLVVVDDSFSLKQQSVIIEVFDEWFSAIPELTKRIEISDEEDPDIANNVGPAPETQTHRRLGSALATVHVTIWTQATDTEEKFRATVKHEIGHFLGARGHHEEEGIMSAHYEPEASLCITQADIDLVCALWGGCIGATYPEC